jgi:hypothetical protein
MLLGQDTPRGRRVGRTGSICVGNEVDDFISDIECEHVIVLCHQRSSAEVKDSTHLQESVDGICVLIKQIRGPRRRSSINRSI